MMGWAFAMMRHPQEAQEFQFALRAIQPIMTDPNETRDIKRKTLNIMVVNLSEKTFSLKPIAEQIITIINMKEDVSKEYPDSETQVEGILGWLPRFKLHRDILLYEVKRNRKQYGLKV